ncbi:MAG: universal stress protein, partial [Halorhabdus sp.]
DILLPTRGGDGSELAVDHAVSIAARFDATLHVIYVVDIRSQAAKHDTYELGELVDELRTAVTDVVTDRADEAGIDTRVAIQQGTPHSAIQRYAADHEVDLIIMGTRGRGRVEQFLLGSITERTIRTADVPVVTVRLDEWFRRRAGGGHRRVYIFVFAVLLGETGGTKPLFGVHLGIEGLAQFANFLLITGLSVVNIALVVNHRKYPDINRGFRVPLVPIIPAIAVLANVALIGTIITDTVGQYAVTLGILAEVIGVGV